MSIGVAPAWAARPLKTAARRSTPDRAEHDRGRLVARLEHRALLDVQLEVGARALQVRAGVVHLREVDVVAGDDVLEPLALAVLEVAHLVDVERARAGRGAEQAAAEARALLVGPVDEAQPDRAVAVGVRAQDLERGEDPQRAVEPAAGGHGVDVRADDHEALLLAREVGPDVAGGVGGDLDRQLLELRAHQLARLAPTRRSSTRGGRRPARRSARRARAGPR